MKKTPLLAVLVLLLSIYKAAGAHSNGMISQGSATKNTHQMYPISGPSSRKLQQHWVGTDMPAYNAASMNWYQGYPNRFRASNAAASFQAASMGSADNFGAGQNQFMGGHRKLQQHWVGTDMPAYNAASMNWYQGYPNRFRASNAAASFQAASMGSADNFGAGQNQFMGGHRKLQQHWVGTDMPAYNAASMNWYQGYPNRFRASNAAASFQAASMGSADNFGAGQNQFMGGHRKLQQHWVGTDMPAYNAASMNWYQGYPNRFRASNAAASFQAASMGSADNFGAGQNQFMTGRR